MYDIYIYIYTYVYSIPYIYIYIYIYIIYKIGICSFCQYVNMTFYRPFIEVTLNTQSNQ